MNVLEMFLGTSGGLDAVINIAVYAVIVLLFIVGVIRCIAPISRTRATIRRAIRSIKQGATGKRSWQEDKFLGKGCLYPHWSEYLNNLFFADGVYHNASNVEDYINEDTAIYGPGRISFAEAIPGLMVSLGFLGTLIGLTTGLSGFDMADAESVQQSIVTLIPGMRYAFMTSIVGVVGSITFTLITRFVCGSAEHTLQDFYGAMSRYAGVLSVDPMTQIAIYQQEQTALIQTMAQDLNGSFTDRMEEVITSAARAHPEEPAGVRGRQYPAADAPHRQGGRPLRRAHGRHARRPVQKPFPRHRNHLREPEKGLRAGRPEHERGRPRAQKRRATAKRAGNHGRPAGRLRSRSSTPPAKARTTTTCASPPMWRRWNWSPPSRIPT